MQQPRLQTSVLLIGEDVRRIVNLVDIFNKVGLHLMFADNADEAMRSLWFGAPDFVVCDMRLPDGTGVDLCRSVRANRSLSRLPIVLVSRPGYDVSCMRDALAAGADDLLSENFDPIPFLAKMLWLIERRQYDEARKQHFEALLNRQFQTLEIVHETSELFRNLARDCNTTASGVQACVDQRIEMGLTMIDSLASMLDEQVSALGLWDDATDNVGRESIAAEARVPR